MNALTIRIPEELQERLLKLSEQEQRSISDVVREALRRYIATEQLRQIRERLRPYAEARGFLTDDDVFKVVS
ncbi:MAG: YlcI/YnfO family protein [Planctomycetota bacterium]